MMAHLIACTLAAAAALAAAWALRRGPARWRYALLLAALMRFAVPTMWLESAGRFLVPLLPAAARAPQAIEDLRRLLAHPGPLAPDPAAPLHSAGPSWLFLLWTSGAAACLWAWARQFRLRPVAVRPSDTAESQAFDRARRSLGIVPAVELRIVAPDFVPGALGLWRPAVALPDGLAAQLTAPELEAVLAHELAHILRRDNLWAAAAHAIVAVFWFHPLAWWMERRLLAERETACDELVLARGASPETYLSGILKVCRMTFAGAHGYAGANGSRLEIRMERIMSASIPRSSRFQRIAAGTLVSLAALFPLAGVYLRAQPQRQTDDQVQARSLFDQGKALLEQKDYDEALRTFRRAYELDPGNVRSLLGMAEVEFALGRTDEAVALLDQESARHPERRDLQLALGNIAVRAGRYALAVSVYTKLLADANSGEAGDLQLRLGETYRRMGNLPQAIFALRRAVEMTPEAVVPQNTLALALDAAGRFPEAEQAYRQVLRLDPNNGIARNNLAYLLASHGGDLDEALDLARHALQSLPQVAETADTLGYVYLARNNAREAFAAFRDAVRLDLTNRTYRNHLLDALGRLSDPPSNAAALQEALRAEPGAANQDLVRGLLK